MFKLYNTQGEITNKIRLFFNENTDCLHKPQLKFIPEVIFGMLLSESIVASDIASKLKEEFSLIQQDSTIKRIHRLMQNQRFKGHILFKQVVQHIINNLKLKHNDKRVHIIIDHMYSSDNYTILMASLRVGKQGIPIWFKAFVGDHNPDAYYDTLLIEMIKDIDELFKDKDFELIFLADRWFNSFNLINIIDSLGHTFIFRLKSNLNIKVYDKKEKHYIRKQTGDLFAYVHHSVSYENVFLFENRDYKTNIVRSKKDGTDDAWILATNGDTKRAIKDYGYRFGGIECLFKNQKSNGFYLEDIVNASMQYFDNLYATLCISLILCVCLGVEYSKNIKCYKNFKLTTHKANKENKLIRVMSVFRTGLMLFQCAFNSYKYIRLPLRFILYDM